MILTTKNRHKSLIQVGHNLPVDFVSMLHLNKVWINNSKHETAKSKGL